MKKYIFFVDFVVVFNESLLYINNKFEDHYVLEWRGDGGLEQLSGAWSFLLTSVQSTRSIFFPMAHLALFFQLYVQEFCLDIPTPPFPVPNPKVCLKEPR